MESFHAAKVVFWFCCLMQLRTTDGSAKGSGSLCRGEDAHGGEIAFLVTMESIIRGRARCNDKEDAPLSVISSSISIYYPHRHEHHRTVSGSRVQFSNPQGFPCHTCSGLPLVQPAFGDAPSTGLCQTSLLSSGQQAAPQHVLCRLLLFHMIIHCCGLHGGVMCGKSAAHRTLLWCGVMVRAGSCALCFSCPVFLDCKITERKQERDGWFIGPSELVMTPRIVWKATIPTL